MPDMATSATPAEDTENTQVSAVDVQSDANSNAPSSGGADTEANSANERQSLLDVVRNAVKKDESADEPSRSSDGNQATSDNDGADASATPAQAGDKDKPDPYDDPKLPFHKHPRWTEIRTELKQYKDRLNAVLPALKRDETISTFMSRNQLEPDDMVQTFRLAALVRNKPEQALVELRQLVADIEGDLGERLPQDLQDAVDDGELTEARALELSKARAAAARATHTVERVAEASNEQQAQAAHQRLMTDLGTFVIEWQKERRSKDPDFDLKFDQVQELVRIRSQAKPPRSLDEGRKYVEDAYKQVTEIMNRARPKPTDKGGQLQGRTSSASVQQDARAPKSFREAIRMAAAGTN